jgi:6-phosphofructokinase 2
MKIATLTLNPAVDKSTTVDRVVAEWKLRCEPPSFEAGGGGINVSRAIRKLGGHSLALYAAGGSSGQVLHNMLDEEDLEHSVIPIAVSTRENLCVFERSTGLQYRFGMPGPTLREEEWQRCLVEISGLIPGVDYLVASGLLPPGVPTDFYGRIARLARGENIRIILDTSGEALRLAVEEEGVYLIKPNLKEFAELTGQTMVDEIQEEERARELIADGKCEVILVSLGAAGVLAVSAEGTDRVGAPLVPIKSKVGAGDSTVAGVVMALARGDSLYEALRFGVAAGSAAVMTAGSELCRREDTERLYRQIMKRKDG